MKQTVNLSISTLLLVMLLAFVMVTSPSSVGPVGVTVFFGLLYLFILSVVELIHRRFFSRRYKIANWLKMFYAMIPVGLLALSSLRQLNSADIVVSLLLLVVVNTYHNKHSIS